MFHFGGYLLRKAQLADGIGPVIRTDRVCIVDFDLLVIPTVANDRWGSHDALRQEADTQLRIKPTRVADSA